MDSSNDALTRVIEQNGNAVGRLDTDTKARLVGDDSIGCFRPSCFPHPKNMVGMHLPRESKLFKPKAECLYSAVSASRECR